MSKETKAKPEKEEHEIPQRAISREYLYEKLETKEGRDSIEVARVLPTFKTNIAVVYGTLRAAMGNYDWCLYKRSTHIDTQELVGFRYNGGLSAEYTGNPEDSLIVDIFRIDEDKLADVDSDLDGLEGVSETYQCYKPTVVPVTVDGEQLFGKFYAAPSRSGAATNDYAVQFYKRRPEAYASFLKDNAPKAYEFYVEKGIFKAEEKVKEGLEADIAVTQ